MKKMTIAMMNDFKYIDTHCHLYESYYSGDEFDSMIKRVRQAHVEYALVPNVNFETIDDIIEKEKQHPDLIKTMIGIHPEDIRENYLDQVKFVEKYLNLVEHSFVGIGEIGLDYFNSGDTADIQKKFLSEMLSLARETKLPFSMHVRDSFDDMFELFEKYQDGNLSGVIHCFTGDEEQAKRFIDLGFYLGIGGIVTFKNSNLSNVLKSVNLDKLVLETDSPYLTPTPHRGLQNDPSYLNLIVNKLVEIYEKSHEEIAQITTKNAKRIFNLK